MILTEHTLIDLRTSSLKMACACKKSLALLAVCTILLNAQPLLIIIVHATKVSGPNSDTYSHWTPIFKWCG